jgi:hypothetical protein
LHQSHIDLLPQNERDKIDKLADLVVTSFTQVGCPPLRKVHFAGHADKDWHGPQSEMSISLDRAIAIRDALTERVQQVWKERQMPPPLPCDPEVTIRTWQGLGSTQMIAPPFHDANRRVEVTLTPYGAPVPVPDTPERRIDRALDILTRVGLKPDATGKRTERTKCILTKLKTAGTDDRYVDGKASNRTINGNHVSLWICGWRGNYNSYVDPKDHSKGQVPLPLPEFAQFFGFAREFVKSALLPCNTEAQILSNLDFLNVSITHGIIRVERYMTANATAFNYAGDLTRWSLKNFTANGISNPNSILSCYSGYAGGEFDSDEPKSDLNYF